jgi:hypothetical protein
MLMLPDIAEDGTATSTLEVERVLLFDATEELIC